jgi:hypothetical protein
MHFLAVRNHDLFMMQATLSTFTSTYLKAKVPGTRILSARICNVAFIIFRCLLPTPARDVCKYHDKQCPPFTSLPGSEVTTCCVFCWRSSIAFIDTFWLPSLRRAVPLAILATRTWDPPVMLHHFCRKLVDNSEPFSLRSSQLLCTISKTSATPIDPPHPEGSV